ncbi:putative glycerol kinase [Ditylenchus destructor]|uniref:Probable glycerol kinase n=1 Tax=Ditylenchus destructor TaxID=166010 RepID=A0AAD4N9X7_9BILA|nr:putative glycerol kinase [Ditylenchus destructor]
MVLLGAIDQGTSSSRFLVFESDTGELVTSHQIEVRQLFPESGWVEMDPDEIYSTIMECIECACAKLTDMGITADEIKAIGIANQRETTVVWDRCTGKPLYNAIVWLDSRTSELAEEYTNKTPTQNKDHFKHKTGLPIHPYFSALKLKWLLNNIEAVRNAKENGTLMFGTVDSWILWKCCGIHATDVTNASRTLLMDIQKRKWSSQMLDFFGIPEEILPRIHSSAEVYGTLKSGILAGVPVSGCLGDQQSAMVGHNCLRAGEAKNTYGTGTFLLCNTGNKAVMSKNGLLTTIGFQFGETSPVCYAIEGSGSIGGNVIRFLRDNLQFIQKASEVEELAGSVDSTDDCYFVPCFTGLYTPYWDSTARGTIVGLNQCCTRAHIARAALKAVAFQTAEMIEAVEHDLEGLTKVQKLKIDGGMTANRLFNQIQADTLGRPIVCSQMSEISGWGAAVAAGIGARQVSMEEFSEYSNPKMTQYSPIIAEEHRAYEMVRWKDAVSRSRNWALSHESS